MTGQTLGSFDARLLTTLAEKNRSIYSGSSSNRVIVQDSVIRDNVGTASGAGIYYHDGSGPHSIIDSVIRDNSSTGSGLGNGNGGGLFMQNTGTGVTIDGCTITGNSANLDGGGIYINNSNPTIRKTVIDSNTSNASGGGVYMNGSTSSITFENSNVTGNTAANTGGGVHLHSSGITANVINSTISKNELTNTTTGQGGGIYANTVNVLIRNSILWGDNSGSKESGYEIFTNNGNFYFEHSVVPNNGNALTKSGAAGGFDIDATNIYTDPLFAGGAPYDYHLKSVSPAIDRGTATGASGDDIDGDSRPQGPGIDIGSDEVSLNSAPVLAWTGEAGYAVDGVSPEGVMGGSTFVFRVLYTDADNVALTSMRVWLDLNDDGDYDDVGEKENMAFDAGDGYDAGEQHNLSEVSAGDTDCTDGKLYSTIRTLNASARPLRTTGRATAAGFTANPHASSASRPASSTATPVPMQAVVSTSSLLARGPSLPTPLSRETTRAATAAAACMSKMGPRPT